MSKLSSTSALVLLWAGQECYKSKKAMEFLNQLDLEEGRDLYEKCEEICPYYDEVIKNRKDGVFNLIKKSFSNENNNFQLVIAGAGLDALGIEVTEHYANTKVFELDNENTEFKYNLYSMKFLEQMRTGSNKYFPTEESGWIEVCLLADS